MTMASKQKSIFEEPAKAQLRKERTETKDEFVPFEESIFAKPKKKVLSISNTSSAESKIDLEEIFSKYKDLYTSEYVSNTRKLNMTDVNTYNTCCINLEESQKMKVINTEANNLVKKVIKSVCTCGEDVFCCYVSMNRTLINLISEVDPSMDTFDMYRVLDKSYAEVIDEFKNGDLWQKS